MCTVCLIWLYNSFVDTQQHKIHLKTASILYYGFFPSMLLRPGKLLRKKSIVVDFENTSDSATPWTAQHWRFGRCLRRIMIHSCLFLYSLKLAVCRCQRSSAVIYVPYRRMAVPRDLKTKQPGISVQIFHHKF